MADIVTDNVAADLSDTSKSGELFERARRVLPSGYTRQMVVAHPYPRYVSHGDGCWITDVDGNRFIDWVNNFSAQIHGHNKAEIVEVIADQAGRVQSTTMPSEWEVRLAEILVDRIAGIDKVRFMNSGTEANIIAVKAARAFTEKPLIAKMEGGYHGQYDLLEASFQPMPDQWGPAEEPTPAAYQHGHPQALLDQTVILPLNDIENARAILRRRADEIAAVILDPWRLQVGMVEPDPAFVAMLREETETLGILLIFDEVWCLRGSYNGYQGLLDIVPDITTAGKIIGGGQPVGAMGGRDEVMAVFDIANGPKIKHSGTFTANAMSMAAGCVAMELMTRAEFDRLNEQSDRLRDGLERIRVDLGLPGRVEGTASVSALLLSDAPMRSYRELLMVMGSGLLMTMQAVQDALMDAGVMTLRGGFVGSTPMTDDDIDFTLDAARHAYGVVQNA